MTKSICLDERNRPLDFQSQILMEGPCVQLHDFGTRLVNSPRRYGLHPELSLLDCVSAPLYPSCVLNLPGHWRIQQFHGPRGGWLTRGVCGSEAYCLFPRRYGKCLHSVYTKDLHSKWMLAYVHENRHRKSLISKGRKQGS